MYVTTGTASDGTVIIEANVPAISLFDQTPDKQDPYVTYQLLFTGNHSSSEHYAVSAGMFVRGEKYRIGYSYQFDHKGKIIRANHIHCDREETKILALVRRRRPDALREFNLLREIFTEMVLDGRRRVNSDFRQTIDSVCQREFVILYGRI